MSEVGKEIIVGREHTPLQNTQPLLNQRRTIRTPKNPMDKCTIVSIYPRAIIEIKHTIEPGVFKIPAGSMENPSTLIVGGSSWWKDVDLEQPLLEIPVGSMSVANSIVVDYCNGMLACNMQDSMPGIFFIPGEYTAAKIKTEAMMALSAAKIKQDTWYRKLVEMADVLWSRTNGNPLTISAHMRLAAEELNLTEKPWMKDVQFAQLTQCPACGSMRNPQFPVCPTCKAIDPNHVSAKDLKFAV